MVPKWDVKHPVHQIEQVLRYFTILFCIEIISRFTLNVDSVVGILLIFNIPVPLSSIYNQYLQSIFTVKFNYWYFIGVTND